MLKLAHKTKAVSDQDQEIVCAATSLEVVRSLFNIALGNILYIRGLLSEDGLETTYLNSSKRTATGGSQSSSSGLTVKVIKRGFSNEADLLLDYLEKGIFDALGKQYLKSFVFAIYLDKEDPNNLVESYTFNVSYHQVGSTNVRAPALSIETSMSQLQLSSQDHLATAAQNGRPPTLGQVKRSIQAMLRHLMKQTETLDELPDSRFATFKIYYYDETPQDYEPPGFVAGDAEKDCFFFATHNVDEAPKRLPLGRVDTGAHAVRVEVASISSALPSAEDHTGTFMGHSSVPIFNDPSEKRRSGIDIQRADALNRQVIWDANSPGNELDQADPDPNSKARSEFPLGVRRGDEIIPIRWKPKENVVRHQAGRHHVPALGSQSSSNAASMEEPTQLLETQPTVVMTQTQTETQMEIDSDQRQQDMNSIMSTPTPTVVRDVPEGRRIHPAIDPSVLRWRKVDCDCKIEDESCETFICQGSCQRRLHVWCMGFETPEEAAHSRLSTCEDCILRGDMVYDLLSETEKHRIRVESNGLAIYRRTLKLVYKNGLPANPHQLQKLIGCTRLNAVKNLKRMEDEGFIESRVVQLDALGLVASNVLAKNARNTKKGSKSAQAKPQLVLVKSSAVTESIKRYFEPRHELVRELIKKYRVKYLPGDKVIPLLGAPAGNVLVPSSSANVASQETTFSTVRATSPPVDSQTQPETQTFVEPDTHPPATPVLAQTITTLPSAPSKRRTSARLEQNRAKRMKISLAQHGVDLETYE